MPEFCRLRLVREVLPGFDATDYPTMKTIVDLFRRLTEEGPQEVLLMSDFIKHEIDLDVRQMYPELQVVSGPVFLVQTADGFLLEFPVVGGKAILGVKPEWENGVMVGIKRED